MEDRLLEKTNRINLLFDFYSPLLTDKQQMFLKYYFQDDYSLGEIASEFDISRQAVYEHVKRAEHVLEDYENKLGLLARYEKRSELMKLLSVAVEASDAANREQMGKLVAKLLQLDEQ